MSGIMDVPARDVLQERAGADRCARDPGVLEVLLKCRLVWCMVNMIGMFELLRVGHARSKCSAWVYLPCESSFRLGRELHVELSESDVVVRALLVPQDHKLHAGLFADFDDVSPLRELGKAAGGRNGGL